MNLAHDLNLNDNRDIRTFNYLASIPYVDILKDIELDCMYYDEKSFIDSFNNNNNICILSLNIQSIQSKFIPFTNLIDNLTDKNALPQFILLQETFIKDDFHFNIKGFKSVFNSRPPNSRGGGTLIYCSDQYNIKHLNNKNFFISNLLEASVVQIESPGKVKFILVSLYRPNTHHTLNNAEQIDSFMVALGEFLEILNNFNMPVICAGDFNLDLFKIVDPNNVASNFLDLFGGFGYLNLITKATRIADTSATALDQIFLNDLSFFRRSGVIVDSPSDHFATFVEINITKPKTKSDPYTTSRRFTTENINRFKNHLLEQNWARVIGSDCVNTACEYFFNTFFELYELCFPFQRVKKNKKYNRINGFMTRGLLKSRSRNLKLAQISKKYPTQQNKNNYLTYRRLYNKLVRLAKKKYFNRKIKDAGNNSKALWLTIKEAINIPVKSNSIGPILKDGSLINSDVHKANYFNTFFSNIGISTAQFLPTTTCSFREYLPHPCPNSLFLQPIAEDTFANFTLSIKPKLSTDVNGLSMRFISSIIHEIKRPLTHIFNTSISTGTFPNLLKTSKCIPIFKGKGDKTLVENYRLVSLVDNFSKPFEKIICSRLLEFLDESNFFLDSQFGFRKRLSTKHAILAIINFITKHLNDNKYVLGIFLDVMKAFDSVDHFILYSKLENAGVRGIVLDWFKSYFEGRFQKVFLNGVYSDNLCRIILGVLQGSILGVILFLIMINDIQNSCPELLCVVFADDDSSLVEDNTLEGLIEKANTGLDKLVNWYSANKLAIHPNKSKCMLFHKSNRSNNNIGNVNDHVINNQIYFPVFINLNNTGESNITKINIIKLVPNEEEKSIKILGIFLDDKLNFKEHIDYVRTKISRSIYTLKQMKHILDRRHLKMLFNAYVKSIVDYADVFYCFCNKKTINPLEIIYKKAIRILSGANYRDHTKPLFIQNKILPIKENSEFNILKLMFRCDQGDLPNCIKNFWRKNRDVSGRDGRNADKFFQETINVKYLETCPYFYYPKLYNELPDEFKLLNSEKEFTKKLKIYLFEKLTD